MRLLVCGGRGYRNAAHVWEVLGRLHEVRPLELLIEGGATGADACARGWATHRGVPLLTVEAEWGLYGRSAGPRRNERMLLEGKPDVVLAFPGGRGTLDMCRRARAHKVPLISAIS